VQISAVACYQDEGPGLYVARWLLGGQQLGIALAFTATIAQPKLPGVPQCVSEP
jgi:hypothetical protein